MNFEHRSQLLKPTDKAQSEMVIGGISEVLHKVAEGKDSVLALPGPDTCFEATGQYGIDGVTEKVNFRKSIAIELHFIFYCIKIIRCLIIIMILLFQLHLFVAKKEDDMRTFVRRYISNVSKIIALLR